MSRAREAAGSTPPQRNRAADFFRTAAIGFVVLGHWMLVAPYAAEGRFEMRSILAEQPWTQYLTWIFQVMPVFFFVGGYSNAASWTSARRTPDRRRLWASSRMRRLLRPVIPLVVLWSLAAIAAYLLGTSPDLIRTTSQAALIPVWFLAVYIMVTLVVPVTYAFWERLGLWSVALLALLAIAVDVVGVGLGLAWVRWVNYAPVWLAVHQIGYWWRRGDARPTQAGTLVLLGIVWLAALILLAHYPVSMVSVTGQDFSNTRPPTMAMAALGAIQIGLMLLAAPAVSRWLKRETPWALVILLGQNIMTIYLWHLTVVIVLIGLSLTLGGPGIQVEPGTVAWWALRPVWVLVLAGALLPFVALFGRVESGSRVKSHRPVGPVQTAIGAVITCVGLSNLALNGIGSESFPGLNWIAVLPVLAGVTLAAGPRQPKGRLAR